MKKWKQRMQPYLLRPFIYMTAFRFPLALVLALLANFFLARTGRDLLPTLFLLAGFIFALLAWIAWLRLDGVRLPKWMMLRFNFRKKPARAYGDIIDYVDEKPQIAFEDLEDDEKDLCILGADLFCCAAFLILSLSA